jgi:hypothetical protein
MPDVQTPWAVPYGYCVFTPAPDQLSPSIVTTPWPQDGAPGARNYVLSAPAAQAEGTWFCLSGTPKDQIAKTALERLKARYAEGIYTVAESCGSAAAQSGAVAATYWVVKTSAPTAAATPSG